MKWTSGSETDRLFKHRAAGSPRRERTCLRFSGLHWHFLSFGTWAASSPKSKGRQLHRNSPEKPRGPYRQSHGAGVPTDGRPARRTEGHPRPGTGRRAWPPSSRGSKAHARRGPHCRHVRGDSHATTWPTCETGRGPHLGCVLTAARHFCGPGHELRKCRRRKDLSQFHQRWVPGHGCLSEEPHSDPH